ncbi:MAG: Smr/MutS family protein [Gammaproteobacteria bacterium]|nr:Smr/MutS family protein [Gammaproteobacteria bacterium]
MGQPGDDDCDDLDFGTLFAGVTRLRHNRLALRPSRRPPPEPRHTVAEQRQVVFESLHGEWAPEDLETGEELLFARPGVPRAVWRRLRRGQYAVQDEIDLHGCTVAAAKAAVAAFLRRAGAAQLGCVRIVHGKGRGSPAGRPVLKGKLGNWLRLREEVLAYCSARPVDGGTGAVYVLLRRSGQ